MTSINVCSEINKSESFSVTRAKTVTKKNSTKQTRNADLLSTQMLDQLGTGFFGIPERLGNGIGMIVRERKREEDIISYQYFQYM